jgi:hypothetical protein
MRKLKLKVKEVALEHEVQHCVLKMEINELNWSDLDHQSLKHSTFSIWTLKQLTLHCTTNGTCQKKKTLNR